jgi:hypothetical protein
MIKYKETFLTFQEYKANNSLLYQMLYLYNKNINDFVNIIMYIYEKIYEITTLGDEIFLIHNNKAKKYYIDKDYILKEKKLEYIENNFPNISRNLNLYFFSNNKNYFNLIYKNDNNNLCYYILDQNLKTIDSIILNCCIPQKCYSIKDKIFLTYEVNGFENGIQKYLHYINILENLNYGKYPFKENKNKNIKPSNINRKENNLFDQSNMYKEPIQECFNLLKKKEEKEILQMLCTNPYGLENYQKIKVNDPFSMQMAQSMYSNPMMQFSLSNPNKMPHSMPSNPMQMSFFMQPSQPSPMQMQQSMYSQMQQSMYQNPMQMSMCSNPMQMQQPLFPKVLYQDLWKGMCQPHLGKYAVFYGMVPLFAFNEYTSDPADNDGKKNYYSIKINNKPKEMFTGPDEREFTLMLNGTPLLSFNRPIKINSFLSIIKHKPIDLIIPNPNQYYSYRTLFHE